MIVDPGGKARRVIGVLSDLEGREQPIEFFGRRLPCKAIEKRSKL